MENRDAKRQRWAVALACGLTALAILLAQGPAQARLRAPNGEPGYLTRDQVRSALSGRFQSMRSRRRAYLLQRSDARRRAAQDGTAPARSIPRDPAPLPGSETLR